MHTVWSMICIILYAIYCRTSFDVVNILQHICRMAFLEMSIDRHEEIQEMQFGRWTEKSSEIDHIYRKDK